jgi:CubicO group peptidase (beta-lactamase class C family)
LRAGLDAYLDQKGATWGEAYAFSGFVLVTQGEKVLYARGGGKVDREGEALIDADTNFRIGSVTKQFTAAAILKLQEEGKLSVSDPINKHLPDYPKKNGERITVHHLLTHTSGIPNYTNDPTMMDWAHKPHSTQEMLELFAKRPLEFEPGEKFRYSNSGYIVLGAIIEQISGQGYGEYIAATLLEPAKLAHTVYGDADALDNRALGYSLEVSEEDLVDADRIDMSVPHAAGAIRSSANDLVAWDAALRGEAILSEASKKALYTPEQSKYAYGWMIDERDGQTIIRHGGGIPGFVTEFIRVPEQELVIVTWTNTLGGDTGRLAKMALDLVAGKVDLPDAEPAAQPMPEDAAERYGGSFQLSPESLADLESKGVPKDFLQGIGMVEISAKDGYLEFDPVGQDTLKGYPMGADRFFVKHAVQTELQFAGPKDSDRMDEIFVEQGSLSLQYARSAN